MEKSYQDLLTRLCREVQNTTKLRCTLRVETLGHTPMLVLKVLHDEGVKIISEEVYEKDNLSYGEALQDACYRLLLTLVTQGCNLRKEEKVIA